MEVRWIIDYDQSYFKVGECPKVCVNLQTDVR